ncbi:MAG: hypothetical protein ACI9OJ_006008 [Myxococcota bacterium]|jgi:hypothetical protein
MMLILAGLTVAGCATTSSHRTVTTPLHGRRVVIHDDAAIMNAPHGIPTLRERDFAVGERVFECYDNATQNPAGDVSTIQLQLRLSTDRVGLEVVNGRSEFVGLMRPCIERVMQGVEWELDGEKQVLVPFRFDRR